MISKMSLDYNRVRGVTFPLIFLMTCFMVVALRDGNAAYCGIYLLIIGIVSPIIILTTF